MAGDVELIPGEGNPLVIAVCQFESGGHFWSETTAIGDLERSFACSCGAKGRWKEEGTEEALRSLPGRSYWNEREETEER